MAVRLALSRSWLSTSPQFASPPPRRVTVVSISRRSRNNLPCRAPSRASLWILWPWSRSCYIRTSSWRARDARTNGAEAGDALSHVLVGVGSKNWRGLVPPCCRALRGKGCLASTVGYWITPSGGRVITCSSAPPDLPCSYHGVFLQELHDVVPKKVPSHSKAYFK